MDPTSLARKPGSAAGRLCHQLWATVRRVRNPLPLFLDRGIQRGPYMVQTRSGLVCELRPGRGDRRSFYEVLIRNDYFGLGQYLNAGDTVIDVGAHIGCFSVLAGHRVGRAGRVIAVEPQPESYRQLLRNIARNGLTNVMTKRAAVGGREGRVRLYTSGVTIYSSVYRHIDGRRNPQDSEEVPMVTLEQVMDEARLERCNYLKVDCEGCEYDIFMNMTPATAARIEQVTVEMHTVEGREPGAVRERLRELGFHLREGRLLYASRERDRINGRAS